MCEQPEIKALQKTSFLFRGVKIPPNSFLTVWMYFQVLNMSSAEVGEACKFQGAGAAAALLRGAQGSELLGCSLQAKCHYSIYNPMLSFGLLSLYQESC